MKNSFLIKNPKNLKINKNSINFLYIKKANYIHNSIINKNEINFNQKNYFKKFVELRSDVKTLPNNKMLKNLLNYQKNGNQKATDKLLYKFCDLFKKESAIFCPTGRMANFIAILLQVKKDEFFILGKRSHLNLKENDSIKIYGLNSILTNKLDPVNIYASEYDIDQKFDSENFKDFDIKEILETRKKEILKGFNSKEKKEKDLNLEKKLANIDNTNLICLENTHIYNGGILLDQEFLKKFLIPLKENYKTPSGKKLFFHLDGSRILNASVASGITPWNLTKDFNTVNICLSKGLGAPCGSILFLEKKNYQKAKNFLEILGGNLLDSDILSSMGIIALEDYERNFIEDHNNAKILSEGINEIKGLLSPKPQTNVVNVYLDLKYFGDPLNEINFFRKYLEKEFDILTMVMNNGKYIRCVLHYQVSKEQIYYAIKAFEKTAKFFLKKKIKQ